MAEVVAVARTTDIKVGTTYRVVVEGVAILLCNVGGGLYAIEDVCTHDGAPLDQGNLDDRRITCPRHGSVFDVITGDVLALPAVRPVRTFAVKVTGGNVYIELVRRKDPIARTSTNIEHPDPGREQPLTSAQDDTNASTWSDRDFGLDAYDKTVADSFPASDPPPGPAAI